MDKVWLRTSWANFRRRCTTRRYARLQAENVRTEQRGLLCQTEMARLQALQVSRSVRQHKRTCFNAWCWRTQKHYRANRNALRERAVKRITLSLVRSVWCKWWRVIEIESWYRAQMEAESCIAEVDERCKSTIDKVRIKAVYAIRGRICTLRTYFLLWRADASDRAREQHSVQFKLSQIESRQSRLWAAFTCWLVRTHTTRIVKKHQMRSAKVKMRSQSLCVRFTERRRNTDRLSKCLALWTDHHHTTKCNKHAVTVSLQRLFRSATANAFEAWCEVVGQSRLLRKVSIKIKFLALKNVFDAWISLKDIVADEAAEAHLRLVHAEAAFGRHTQAQVRYVFSAWRAAVAKRLKCKQLMSRVVHRRKYAAVNKALARWVESTRIEQREQQERKIARQLEAQQAALQEAQALIDRSEMGHMLNPRLVMLRRAFKVWKTSWQDQHEISLILVRTGQVKVWRMLRAAFSAWWQRVTSLESLSSAQLAAQGKALQLHGSGPALARWWYNRCDSVTKRIGSELTQLIADSQLYDQAIDIGGEWQVDVSPTQELNGRFWLQTEPLQKTAHQQPPLHKGNHLLGASPQGARSPTARLGNRYVYAASQTRDKSNDFLQAYAQEGVAAAMGVRRPSGTKRARSTSRSQPSASGGTPKARAASPRQQLWLEDDSDRVSNCCVFEVHLQ